MSQELFSDITYSTTLDYQNLQANPLIKIRFPSYLSSHKWTIEEKNKKLHYSVPFLSILIIIASTKPIHRIDLINSILRRANIDRRTIEIHIETLIEKDLLLTGNSETLSQLKNKLTLLDIWRKRGWEEAGEYHWFTWDFRFLDYSKGGAKQSINLMHSYHDVEPDIQRSKTYENCSHKIELLSPKNTLLNLKQNKEKSGLTNFFSILSIGFVKHGNMVCAWTPTSLIKRTSPSGGSRHPTEGYVLIINIPELKAGWHHIQTDPSFLVSFDRDLNMEKFSSIFPRFQRKKCSAILVLTCVFERNMYRYREARTFRSIHMDAGHILGTIEMFGQVNNFETQISYDFSERAILNELKLNPFKEGIMACMAISLNE